MRGYYQLAAPPTQAQLDQVVKDWNADLELTNRDRAAIERDWKDVGEKLKTTRGTDLAAQRRSYYQQLELIHNYKIADPTRIEPLGPIQSAAELPDGYRVGYDAAELGARRALVRQGAYGFALWAFFAALALTGGVVLAVRGAVAAASHDLRDGVIFAAALIAVGISLNSTGFDLRQLIINAPWIGDFLSRSWPPNTKFLADVSREMLITITTALLGTLIASVFALPLSLLAARNLTERSWLTRIAYLITRVFFNINRGIDTLIVALVFVSALGLGPFAGVLAIALHSIADLGKLYSEAMENSDKGPIEALESAGAPGSSVIRWALMPQLLPLLMSYTLYRFEINFRVSIVLGFVGAGGIGFLVNQTMRGGEYPSAMVAIIVIVLVVNVLDFISATVRRRLV
nr:phosphonate ABC transporter, permease protein PhnE [Deinobacterium chartae]